MSNSSARGKMKLEDDIAISLVTHLARKNRQPGCGEPHRSGRYWLWIALIFSAMVVKPVTAQHGVWLEGYPFRRGVEVQLPGDKLAGSDEVAQVEFYTAGHIKPSGEDIRVATDEGRVVASRVLMTTPGDRASVAFALVKGVKRYNVFFGHPQPPAKSKGTEDISLKSGLLLEMKVRTGREGSAKELEAAWESSQTPIGQTLIDTLFVGFSPFEDRSGTIARARGTLNCPLDGMYLFALSAQDRGALFIDGKAVVFGAGLVGDIRHNAKVELTKGPHALVFYVAGEGEGRFSVVWKRPDTDKIEVIPPAVLGLVGKGIAGPLEEVRKPLIADFRADYAGECFYDNHYSYRYTFMALLPKGLAAAVKYEWDFGDGQTASGVSVEHVYLDDGIFPIKLAARLGNTVDVQTNRFAAHRDREKMVNPPTDQPVVQSKITTAYDVTKLPPALLPWAVLLHQRAHAVEPMLAAAKPLAATPSGVDPTAQFGALQEATEEALLPNSAASAHATEAIALWDLIPGSAVIKPRSVKYQAELLLWYSADIPAAARVLEPYAASGDPYLRRLYGQALVLNHKPDEGRKVLTSLPIEGPSQREAAITGAMARTVDYFVGTKDWESGEEAWSKWQARYPHDFLGGYSVMLQTQLMEIRGVTQAAARVAEAFAGAMPRSPYAPRLLDRASKLLAVSNPPKSQALRAALKQRYPEDALSQDP